MEATKREWPDIKVGDIVTTYHKGYWRVIDITRRFHTQSDIDRYSVYKNKGVKAGDEYAPLLTYVKVLTADFKPVGKKPPSEQCDASYCRKVTKDLVKKMRLDYTEQLERLLALLE